MKKKSISNEMPLWSFQFKSSSKVEVLNRKDIESKLVSKALKDERFKSKLKENSKITIEEMFDITLPTTLLVSVVEETESLIYFILPHNPYLGTTEAELKDALGINLEELAGWVLDQRKELLGEDKENNLKLIAKAWKNDAFKKLLIIDPVAVIENELDQKIDSKITIKVLEETKDHIYINIPQLPDIALLENELDAHFVNMPMVIGSHQNTAGFLGNCSVHQTHSQALFCTDTRSRSAECVDVKTIYPGYNGCGGVCTLFSLIPG